MNKKYTATLKSNFCAILDKFMVISKGTRYKSWEHCHEAFKKAANGASFVCPGYLSLQLGFYLASWGMYRGSSFLLQYDYTIHDGAVKIVLDPKYHDLFDPYLWKTNRSRYIDLAAEVYEELMNYYKPYHRAVKKGGGVSDTLITKILLGVYGCIPAFDRFVKASLNKLGCPKSITVKNIKGVLEKLLDLLNNFAGEIDKELHSSNYPSGLYTPMKIFDIFLWLWGAYIVSDEDIDSDISDIIPILEISEGYSTKACRYLRQAYIILIFLNPASKTYKAK